jgi:SAM-dependent methyltransferase
MTNYCCTSSLPTEGTNRFFSKKAKSFLKKFRRRGLAKEQRLLMEGVMKGGITGKSILEIGCGVGGLHLSLLKSGGASATGIEISEGMIEGALQLSKEMDMEARTTYLLGDFVVLHDRLSPADVTLLDKVVCCYEDLDILLDRSIAKTSCIYGLTYPRPSGLFKTLIGLAIRLAKLLNAPFHPYWHDWEKMTGKIQNSGFVETYQGNTMFWEARVYCRINGK